jgi:hypothetical protein
MSSLSANVTVNAGAHPVSERLRGRSRP